MMNDVIFVGWVNQGRAPVDGETTKNQYIIAAIIFSTSAKNVYAILRLFKRLHVRRDIIYWVIGGAFSKHVRDGKFKADVFNYIKYNLVQCPSMIDELKEAGVTNARFVSNFKPFPIIRTWRRLWRQGQRARPCALCSSAASCQTRDAIISWKLFGDSMRRDSNIVSPLTSMERWMPPIANHS